jgi:2-methylcitrate dehydratase
VDALRAKMEVIENAEFTRDYLDPAKRSIGTAVQVFFSDGSATPRVAVEYPVGHRRRRKEGVPLLLAKFEAALRGHFPAAHAEAILALSGEHPRMDAMEVRNFCGMFALQVSGAAAE